MTRSQSETSSKGEVTSGKAPERPALITGGADQYVLDYARMDAAGLRGTGDIAAP